MLELLKIRNKNCVNLYHDMMKMKTWLIFTEASFRDLFNKWYFDVVNIVCDTHVVFEIDNIRYIKYIKHCIDWEQCNTL